MPMALQTLPPLLMLPAETAPPLAEDVATPPFPAEAVSMYCAATLPTPARPTTAPATTALTCLFTYSPPYFPTERPALRGPNSERTAGTLPGQRCLPPTGTDRWDATMFRPSRLR